MKRLSLFIIKRITLTEFIIFVFLAVVITGWLLSFCLFVAYCYFKNKRYRKMINSLNIGDKIASDDGVMCEILEVYLEYFVVKISDENTAKLHKDFVCRKIDN